MSSVIYPFPYFWIYSIILYSVILHHVFICPYAPLILLLVRLGSLVSLGLVTLAQYFIALFQQSVEIEFVGWDFSLKRTHSTAQHKKLVVWPTAEYTIGRDWLRCGPFPVNNEDFLCLQNSCWFFLGAIWLQTNFWSVWTQPIDESCRLYFFLWVVNQWRLYSIGRMQFFEWLKVPNIILFVYSGLYSFRTCINIWFHFYIFMEK